VDPVCLRIRSRSVGCTTGRSGGEERLAKSSAGTEEKDRLPCAVVTAEEDPLRFYPLAGVARFANAMWGVELAGPEHYGERRHAPTSRMTQPGQNRAALCRRAVASPFRFVAALPRLTGSRRWGAPLSENHRTKTPDRLNTATD
jgi:hypothetical protein